MQYSFKGFSEKLGFRVLAYEGISEEHTKYTVSADLGLVRKYGIRVQELPLLCRTLLDRGDALITHALVFTEGDMRQHASGCAALAAAAVQKRQSARRLSSIKVKSAWRDLDGRAFSLAAAKPTIG